MNSFFDRLSYTDVAKAIDHSLLKPELDDASLEAGCKLAARYDVASVCVRPRDVERARDLLSGSTVAVGTVVGFPHGSSRTETKVFEARLALQNGARELDMVIDIGGLISGDDSHVREQIADVVKVAHAEGALVKVILENAYLTDEQKVRGCQLVEAAGADFVKTSTGYAPTGATIEDLKLMRRSVSQRVGVKAAHGIRTLDGLVEVLELGVTRVGATQTAAMLDEFTARKANNAPAESPSGAFGATSPLRGEE